MEPLDRAVSPIVAVLAMAATLGLVLWLSAVRVLPTNEQSAVGRLRHRRPPPVVTQGEVDRLRPGQSYDGVVREIGAREDFRRRDAGGVEILTWTNPDGSGVELAFRNGRFRELVGSTLSRAAPGPSGEP